MTSEPIAVRGTRRSMKELVDGTIRVQIDIDPPYRKAFLQHFGEIDMPVAIALLTPASTLPSDSQWTPEQLAEAAAEGAAPLEIPKLKGGELSRLAGIWCLDERFQNWLQTFYMIAWTDAGAHEELDEERAAHVVRWLCGVTSRADLDHNTEAKALFDELFRIPYSQYLKENA